MDTVGIVGAGHATREDLDQAMRLGCGHPMGPLTLRPVALAGR